jgi:hypothetical protein
MNKSAKFLGLAIAAAILQSCASLTLENVDFNWPVESALTVSATNTIEDGRYSIVCNVAPLATKEFEDSTALRGATLRVLRNVEGYYFLTGPKFKHVYVFTTGVSELSMKSAIEVSQTGLVSPKLNQHPPYVELLDGNNQRKLLTKDEIVEEKK